MCEPHSFGCRDLIGIDPKISCLVYILNSLGVRTKASCEGHITDWHYPFPWICIAKDDFDLAMKIIRDYNQKNCFQWKVSLHEAAKEWVVQPVLINKSLDYLHEEVLKLTRFLSRRLIKKERL